ncbi:hypothetical protein COCNU_07G008860 [Cocos nucifera]|uniref:Uncharacterized protein n=1 Tax=Cocos nucifera TaxID=13894 RepID=A0A8K0IFR8_COCNU|nr:hypothetical protein COCNU_07G008860 [Cocos nucifera]
MGKLGGDDDKEEKEVRRKERRKNGLLEKWSRNGGSHYGGRWLMCELGGEVGEKGNEREGRTVDKEWMEMKETTMEGESSWAILEEEDDDVEKGIRRMGRGKDRLLVRKGKDESQSCHGGGGLRRDGGG